MDEATLATLPPNLLAEARRGNERGRMRNMFEGVGNRMRLGGQEDIDPLRNEWGWGDMFGGVRHGEAPA